MRSGSPLRGRRKTGDATSLIRDTEIEEILHQDADPIFIAAGINPKAVTLHIIGSNDLNAFVSGGQQMFVYAGLIMKAETPNQLIGVMAHEPATWPAATWCGRTRARKTP